MAKFSGFSTGFSSIQGRSANLASYYLQATGGTVTTVGDYKYHAFTQSGAFAVNRLALISSLSNVIEVLVVAGGGGGGGFLAGTYTGAGGGGGVIHHPSYTISATNYTITVGNGGNAGAAGNTAGTQGGNSSIILTSTSTTLFRAIGGGAGSQFNANGGNGGSGGGAGPYVSYSTTVRDGGLSTQASAGVNPAGSTYYGNSGGVGYNFNYANSGGGGGAGGAGGATGGGLGGDAVPGLGVYISSFSTFGDPNNLGYFASGGAGCLDGYYLYSPGIKPGGGGGRYSPGTSAGEAGLANTGGGGAGSGYSGGSGVVIIRYRYQ